MTGATPELLSAVDLWVLEAVLFDPFPVSFLRPDTALDILNTWPPRATLDEVAKSVCRLAAAGHLSVRTDQDVALARSDLATEVPRVLLLGSEEQSLRAHLTRRGGDLWTEYRTAQWDRYMELCTEGGGPLTLICSDRDELERVWRRVLHALPPAVQPAIGEDGHRPWRPTYWLPETTGHRLAFWRYEGGDLVEVIRGCLPHWHGVVSTPLISRS